MLCYVWHSTMQNYKLQHFSAKRGRRVYIQRFQFPEFRVYFFTYLRGAHILLSYFPDFPIYKIQISYAHMRVYPRHIFRAILLYPLFNVVFGRYCLRFRLSSDKFYFLCARLACRVGCRDPRSCLCACLSRRLCRRRPCNFPYFFKHNIQTCNLHSIISANLRKLRI